MSVTVKNLVPSGSGESKTTTKLDGDKFLTKRQERKIRLKPFSHALIPIHPISIKYPTVVVTISTLN
jgi:hypothetical protein